MEESKLCTVCQVKVKNNNIIITRAKAKRDNAAECTTSPESVCLCCDRLREELASKHEIIKILKGDIGRLLAEKETMKEKLSESYENKGCEIVIPPKSNRKVQREYDKHTYKERYLIECLFGKIKHFRRIFSRFDKASATFLAFLNFVGTLIWLR